MSSSKMIEGWHHAHHKNGKFYYGHDAIFGTKLIDIEFHNESSYATNLSTTDKCYPIIFHGSVTPKS